MGEWTNLIVTSILIPVGAFFGKLLVDHWTTQQKDIEKYKAKNATHIMDDLSDELRSLKSKIATENQRTQELVRALRKEIAEHKALIMNQKGQIDTVMKVFEGTLDSARKITQEMDTKVDAKIQTEIRKIRDMIYVGTKKIAKGTTRGE